MSIETGGPASVVRDYAVPLYHQIYVKLREEIISGERAYGSRMPTELELSEQFAVSRITARRALDELADQGLVERRRRIGTTVVFRSPVKPIQGNIEQALDSLLSFGMSTKVSLLEFDRIKATAPIDEILEVPPQSDVLRVVRVRWLEGQPVGHFVTFIPAPLGRKMTKSKLSSTPMLKLLEDAGVQIGSARQTVSATLADAALASALQVDVGSPILRVSRTVLDVDGRPVQHILAQYRSDRYQIRLDLNSSDSAAQLI